MAISYRRIERKFELVLLVSVLCLICLQLFMIPRANFNWDEFNELSQLFSKESGYQTAFLRGGLHYLAWPLKYLPYPEDVLLTIARYWSFCIGVLGIYYMVFRIGASLRSPLFGLIAVFLTATFSTFFESSIQYRTDPFTTLFFLVSFYQVLQKGTKPPPWLVPGLLLGTAMFINPKALYHFLILLASCGYFWCYSKEKKTYLVNTLYFVTVAVGSLIVLLLFHAMFYDIPLTKIAGSFERSSQVGFGHVHGWSLKSNFLLVAIYRNWFPSACLLAGSVLAFFYFVSTFRFSKKTNCVMVAAFLQALTVLVHQGVYKYYIIDILPLLAILGALAPYKITLRILRSQTRKARDVSVKFSYFIIFFFFVGSFIGIVSRLDINMENTTVNQRLCIKYLRRMFPANIPYADGFGLLSKYNNVLRFFSTKKYIAYYRAGRASFEGYFAEGFPVLIIESSRFFVDALLPEDQEFIRSNFIPYFGQKFWIYGFRIKGDELKKRVKIYLKTGGPYTLNGDYQHLLIDGHPPHTPVCLESGFHVLECGEECGDILLTYGEKCIDKVIPNFTLQPDSAGVARIETPGRYYLAKDLSASTASRVMVDGSPAACSNKLEKQSSIYLRVGNHTYENPLNSPVSFHLIGPLFFHNIHH